MGPGSLPLGLLLSLAASTVRQAAAADVRRHDGVHRIEKAQITARAVLGGRDAVMTAGVCGTSSKLCPASLDGGCCPDGYDCARESCQATTKGPSTCRGKVGWRACDARYGGGCCPDNFICQVEGCVPASGVAYTFGCPASQFLCPSSLGYGCCPNGMGCASNQCYSTEPVTRTVDMTVTTTQSGKSSASTYTTRTVTTSTPTAPTKLSNLGDDTAVVKFFPTAVDKATPSPSPEADNGGGGGGGLTKGQLAGIVTGAVLFLLIVIAVAVVVIRHLNKVVDAVTASRSGGGSQPQMRHQGQPAFEVDSLYMPGTHKAASDVASSTGQTPTSFAGHYQHVSAVPSIPTTPGDGYFDLTHHQNNPHGQGQGQGQGQGPRRTSQQSGGYAPERPSNDSYAGYTHVRSWSDASEESGNSGHNHHHQQGVPQPFSPTLITELDSRAVVPELPGSPGSSVAADDHRRSSIVSSISSIMSRSHSQKHHQRMRSATGGSSSGGAGGGKGPGGAGVDTGVGLGTLSEESSPSNTLGPQQRKPSWAQGDDGHPR